MCRIKDFVGCQVIRDGGCGFSEHIGHNGVESHIAYGESILKTVLYAAFHTGQLVTVPGQLPKNTGILIGDKAALHDTDTEKFTDPFGIFGIILFAFYGTHPFGVGNDNTQTSLFQNVEHRNPILSGRFHADIEAVVSVQPVSEPVQVGIKCGETTFLIVWFQTAGLCGDNGSDKEILVDIYTAANGIYDFQQTDLLIKV